MFSNSKPWVDKHIKSLIKEKKKVFHDKDKLKTVQSDLKRAIKRGKREYKTKIEQNFQTNDMKKVWEGMHLMSGRKKVNKPTVLCTSNVYANEMNDFYARFDCHDFSEEKKKIVHELLNESEMYNDVIIDEFEVLKAMKSINPSKACGPDNLSPKVIKLCADQLCGIFSFIFNLSLSDCQIPEEWKTSCIIP